MGKQQLELSLFVERTIDRHVVLRGDKLHDFSLSLQIIVEFYTVNAFNFFPIFKDRDVHFLEIGGDSNLNKMKLETGKQAIA